MTLDLSRLAELEALFSDLRDYFDNRADADYINDRFVPNDEMYLLKRLDDANVPALLQELRASRAAVEAARDAALEEAEKVCERVYNQRHAEFTREFRSKPLEDADRAKLAELDGEALAASECCEGIRSLRARAAEAPRG